MLGAGLVVAMLAGAASAQAPPAPPTQESLAARVAALEARVAELESSVAELEGRPEALAEQADERAGAYAEALSSLAQVQEALAEGQSDVVEALGRLRTALQETAESGGAGTLERARADAADGAIAAALDDLSREDLFSARGALDVAALQIWRARSQALIR